MDEKYINILKIKSEELSKICPGNLPGYKAVLLFAKYFREFGLPLKHIGKIKINVIDEFFDNEDLAGEIVKNFTILIRNLRTSLHDEFGDDAEEIFIDMLKQFSFTYNV